MYTKLKIGCLIMFAGFVTAACASLLPGATTVETAAKTEIEKHGAAFEECTKNVLRDTVIVSANAILQVEHSGLTVDVAARVLHGIALKEAEALKVCAAGGTPEKLWAPGPGDETPTVPDAGPPVPPGAVETNNGLPTQHI